MFGAVGVEVIDKVFFDFATYCAGEGQEPESREPGGSDRLEPGRPVRQAKKNLLYT